MVVGINDGIRIEGPGTFNIILDNVSINISEKVEGYCTCPLHIQKGANVNLTLIGDNTMKSNLEYSEGIYADYESRLTISEESAGSSLNVSGSDYGIVGTTVTVKGGKITIGGEYGILGNDTNTYFEGSKILNPIAYFIIDGGEITAPKFVGDNIVVNGGTITMDEIYVKKQFEMNDGNILVSTINGESYHIDNLKEIFGTYNDIGKLAVCSKEKEYLINNDMLYEIVGYYLTSENNQSFYLLGGIINGVDMANKTNNRVLKNSVEDRPKSIFDSLCDIDIYCFN
jgi:hypothetical protein